jgi:hypothetical protein
VGQRIVVDAAALAQPAGRFRAGGGSLAQLGDAVRWVLTQAGEAAQHPVVHVAADAFGTATGAVLGAFGEECRAMADKLDGAATTYTVTDQRALSVNLHGLGVLPDERGGK